MKEEIMRKRVLAIVLSAVVMVFFMAPVSRAAMCSKCKMMGGGMKSHQEGLEGKFYKKVMFLLKNHEELDLTDKQIDDIKALKYKVKKEVISKDTSIDMTKAELSEEMWKDEPSSDILNKLTDRKYELKKEKDKILSKGILDLKAILTKEQAKECKKLYMKQLF
jgi:Spy/CpxP family protein refolding chaperone